LTSAIRRGDEGFTLLEVLVAFAILAVVMGALSSVVGQSLNRLLTARLEQQASRLAEQKAREIVAAAESGELPDVGVDEGEFEDLGEGDTVFRYRVEIEPFVLPRPDGIKPELLKGSALYGLGQASGRGGSASAVRRVEVRVFPEAKQPEQSNPFVMFLTEPAEPPGAPNATDRDGQVPLNQGLGGLNDLLRRQRN